MHNTGSRGWDPNTEVNLSNMVADLVMTTDEDEEFPPLSSAERWLGGRDDSRPNPPASKAYFKRPPNGMARSHGMESTTEVEEAPPPRIFYGQDVHPSAHSTPPLPTTQGNAPTSSSSRSRVVGLTSAFDAEFPPLAAPAGSQQKAASKLHSLPPVAEESRKKQQVNDIWGHAGMSEGSAAVVGGSGGRTEPTPPKGVDERSPLFKVSPEGMAGMPGLAPPKAPEPSLTPAPKPGFFKAPPKGADEPTGARVEPPPRRPPFKAPPRKFSGTSDESTAKEAFHRERSPETVPEVPASSGLHGAPTKSLFKAPPKACDVPLHPFASQAADPVFPPKAPDLDVLPPKPPTNFKAPPKRCVARKPFVERPPNEPSTEEAPHPVIPPAPDATVSPPKPPTYFKAAPKAKEASQVRSTEEGTDAPKPFKAPPKGCSNLLRSPEPPAQETDGRPAVALCAGSDEAFPKQPPPFKPPPKGRSVPLRAPEASPEGKAGSPEVFPPTSADEACPKQATPFKAPPKGCGVPLRSPEAPPQGKAGSPEVSLLATSDDVSPKRPTPFKAPPKPPKGPPPGMVSPEVPPPSRSDEAPPKQPTYFKAPPKGFHDLPRPPEAPPPGTAGSTEVVPPASSDDVSPQRPTPFKAPPQGRGDAPKLPLGPPPGLVSPEVSPLPSSNEAPPKPPTYFKAPPRGCENTSCPPREKSPEASYFKAPTKDGRYASIPAEPSEENRSRGPEGSPPASSDLSATRKPTKFKAPPQGCGDVFPILPEQRPPEPPPAPRTRSPPVVDGSSQTYFISPRTPVRTESPEARVGAMMLPDYGPPPAVNVGKAGPRSGPAEGGPSASTSSPRFLDVPKKAPELKPLGEAITKPTQILVKSPSKSDSVPRKPPPPVFRPGSSGESKSSPRPNGNCLNGVRPDASNIPVPHFCHFPKPEEPPPFEGKPANGKSLPQFRPENSVQSASGSEASEIPQLSARGIDQLFPPAGKAVPSAHNVPLPRFATSRNGKEVRTARSEKVEITRILGRFEPLSEVGDSTSERSVIYQ